MKKGLVSIITPMYKGAEFVGECIESVQKQTYTQWEMIIVDDCSPDNGAGIDVVSRYTANDTRVRLIANKKNGGSSAARNTALRVAEGEYIAFLDSDDIWCPDFLEKQLSFMRENDAQLVFSSYYRIDEKTKEEILRPYICPSKVSYKSMLRSCPIFPSTAIFDAGKLGMHYFNEKMGSLRDDYVYWLQILKKIKYGYGNQEILAYYRMRKMSVTANKKNVIKPQWRVLRHVEKRPFFECCYNMVCWAVISYFKYRK